MSCKIDKNILRLLKNRINIKLEYSGSYWLAIVMRVVVYFFLLCFRERHSPKRSSLRSFDSSSSIRCFNSDIPRGKMKATSAQQGFSNYTQIAFKAILIIFLFSNSVSNSSFKQISTAPPGKQSQLSTLPLGNIESKEKFNENLSSLGITKNTVNKLQNANINSYAQLREKAALYDLQGFSSKEMKTLQGASTLSLLSNDQELNRKFLAKNIYSVQQLKKLSANELVKISDGRLDEPKAQEFKNRVRGLDNLVQLQARRLYVGLRNPSPLYSKPNVPAHVEMKMLKSVSGSAGTCSLKCDESNDIFSPAAYLLYLLDFIEKSFGSSLDDLQKINNRFKQKFEDLTISQDASQSKSYIQFTNDVLENLIAENAGDPWPNSLQEAERIKGKSKIYARFKSEDVPYPDLLINLFDSFVREFGTNRKEVRFIQRGSISLKTKFAESKGMTIDDLNAINLQNEAINFVEISDLKDRLFLYYQRKTDKALRQEFISKIEEEKRKEFQKAYLEIVDQLVENVMLDSLNRLPKNLPDEDFDRALLKIRGLASNCVHFGINCPKSSEFKNNPLNQIEKLFERYADFYPEYKAGNSKNKFAEETLSKLETKIKEEKLKELKFEYNLEDASTPSDSILAKLQEEATNYAKERIKSAEEFDNQLHHLAELVFEKELHQNEAVFNDAVESRATEQWQIAVSRAETGYLAKIRENLAALQLRLVNYKNPTIFTGNNGYLHTVKFRPDGACLAAVDHDRNANVATIRGWNAFSGDELFSLPGHNKGIIRFFFCNDGKWLVAGGIDRTITVWNTFLAQKQYTISLENASNYPLFTCGFDGLQLAAVNYDTTVEVWDILSEQKMSTINSKNGWVYTLSLSPDGRRLATVCEEFKVDIWDVVSGEHFLELSRSSTDRFLGVKYSPAGNRLITWKISSDEPSTDERKIDVWNSLSGDNLFSLIAASEKIALSPDGVYLATTWSNKKWGDYGGNAIKIWNLQNGDEVLSISGHEKGLIWDIAFSNDDKYLATASLDKTTKIWDTRSGYELRSLTGHQDLSSHLEYSPLGTHLAISSDSVVTLYDLTPNVSVGNIDSLANYLHLDLTVDETYKTTPLAFAINRIHSFIQAVRLGTEPNYSAENFDENTWSWLKSYGTWHAAMMVSLYPENFLFPPSRYNKTPSFKMIVDSALVASLDYQQTLKAYYKSLLDLQDMHLIGIARVEHRTFIFSRVAKGFYYSVLYDNGKWKPWKKIDLSVDIPLEVKTIVGYLPNDMSDQHFVHFFTFVRSYFKDNTGKEKPQWDLHYATFEITLDNELRRISGEWTPIENARMRSGRNPIYDSKIFMTRKSEYGIRYLIISYLFKNMRCNCSFGFDNNGLLYSTHVDTTEDEFYTDISEVVSDLTGMGTLWRKNYNLYLSVGDRFREHITNVDCSWGNLALGLASNGSTPIICFSPCDANKGPLVMIEENNNFIKLDSLEDNWLCKEVLILENKVLVFGQKYSQPFYAFHDQNLGSGTFHDPHQLSLDSNTRSLLRDKPKEVYKSINLNDPARIYLDEYHLHLPFQIAEYQNEAGLYEEAMASLSQIYNIMGANEQERQVYPAFDEGAGSREIGSWLEDPFNPFAMADLNKEIYLLHVKFAHVKNLLDWADQLFTQDTPESVNRARELYELAAKVLNMHEWPQDACDLEWHSFRSHPQSDNYFAAEDRAKIDDLIREIQKLPHQNLAPQISNILSSSKMSPFKIAALEKIKNEYASQSTLEDILTISDGSDIDEDQQALGLAHISDATLTALEDITIGDELPDLFLGFCIPMNPMVNLFRWRIQSNLDKIRTNRNYAGMQRELQPYAIPVDPTKMVKGTTSEGFAFEQFIPSTPPPIYRYSFLLERSKYLISVAQQFENSMLSSIEKEEQESYSYMRAKQDIKLEQGNVTLQGLRCQESEDLKTQADNQKNRAIFQNSYYDDLIQQGLIFWEESAIENQVKVLDAYGVGMGWQAITTLGNLVSGLGGDVPGTVAAYYGAKANLAQTRASFARREQEWIFQKKLSNWDITLADDGVRIANDRINIVNQENNIAHTRLEFANDVVEFLGNKFTGRELYRWMNKNLQKLYHEQLNLATATARVAQNALEFERQTSLDFIGHEYWDDERRGLLAAERLLSDINKMEQFRLSTASRKKEIEKTISLASMMPAEFQRFRETGVLEFATLPQWFDRDFPGHYMRLIRDVRLTVLALLSSNEGIHATLSNPGISRVMVSEPFEEPSIIYRYPESIAISSPYSATGLFELRQDDPMLLPFEGSGVATSWHLEMPKGANRFDYDTIADILVTIRYTALEDKSYREKVLADMGQDELGYVATEAVRYFSLRDEFPDQWYYFNNPSLTTYTGQNAVINPFTMAVDIAENDFVPNEHERKIKKVTLAASISDNYAEDETIIPMTLQFVPLSGAKTGEVTIDIQDAIASTEEMNGRRPYGKWILKLDTSDTSNKLIYPTQERVDTSKIENLLLIIEYQAKVHYNR